MTQTTTQATQTTPTITPRAGAVDADRLDALIGRITGDFAATLHAASVAVGHKLGLFRALADSGPATGAELAGRTGLDRRLVEEWCNAQYVSGYCERDAATGRFALSPEQRLALATPDHPAFLAGTMVLAGTLFKDEALVREAFRSGAGLPWHAHDDDLFVGTDTLFRPGYAANLVESWIPALDGVEDRLRAGATVADVGCGYGASTVLMAEAYPASAFVGYDSHGPSIEAARARAAEAGVADRVRFEVATADRFVGSGYDLVCVFDALHDMGDPVAAARWIRDVLADDGTWLLVEPMAGERLEDNVNPVGRIFYSAAPFICAAHAESEGGRHVLGNQVPDSQWRELLAETGFTRFRRAAETPFNRVFEVRP